MDTTNHDPLDPQSGFYVLGRRSFQWIRRYARPRLARFCPCDTTRSLGGSTADP